MPTHSALTTVAGEAAARALGEAVERMTPPPEGVGVFEIEDGSGRWEVGAYFESAPDTVVLAILAAAFGAQEFAVSELPDTDWVAHVQRELHPVEAGRFFLYGSHDAHRLPEGRIGLMIEASMAFGTGHHDTTRGCLLALDALFEGGFRPQRVADIGTGTAVLAMAAALLLPRAHVAASDIDPVAVEVARTNVAVNGLAGRIACIEAAGFDHPLLSGPRSWDLVFANILAGPLIAMAPELARALAQRGQAILSGLLTTQAEAVTEACMAAGLAPESRRDLGDWATLVVTRRD